MRLRPIAWLLGVTACLLVAWSLVVPIFEAPDEPAHWQYARYLHDHRALPPYAPGFQEANSPPLYYLAIAPFAKDAGSPSIVLTRDETGVLASLAPPHFFLNSDRDFRRYWPIRFARLISAAMSLATVWFTYLAGRTATGSAATGLLAAIVVAFLPQFTFRGTNVSNDALVTMLAAATTLMMVRMVKDGFTWRHGLGAAALLAGAYLSKINAVALAAPLALVLVAAPPAGTSWTRRLLRLGVFGLTLLLVLPWSLHNVWRYGDPFASGAMHTAVAHIITERPLFSRYFVASFPKSLALSFVGAFGWMNVVLPIWVYAAFGALGLLVVVGLLVGLRKPMLDLRLLACLVLTVFAALAIVVYINLSFTQAQGRYMFPALTAMAVLSALGLQSLVGPLRVLARPPLLATLLAGVNVYALAGIVGPSYYPPLARDVAPNVRELYPGLLTDMGFSPRTESYFVTGPDPAWVLPVDVDASSFSGLDVELTATHSSSPQLGCVYVATSERTMGENRPRCFTWHADGRRQRLHVPLAQQPGWNGRVTHVRVDPFDRDTSRVAGAHVRLGYIRLVGSWNR